MADDQAPRRLRKQRVLFTMVELATGGIETNVLGLMGRLAPDQYDLSLFLHHGPKSGGDVLLREVPANVDVSWALRGVYRRWKLPFVLSQLLRAARGCDLIVAAQEGRSTLLACIAGALLRKPVVGWIQFDWVAMAKHVRRRQIWGLRWLCPRMTNIVACGRDVATSLQQIVPIEASRLTVIPNAVDTSRVLGQVGLPQPPWAAKVFTKPVIAGMGRMTEQKGFDVLVRAHALLRSYGIDHHLLILGEGHLRRDLAALAETLGVADSLFMPGFCDKPFALLRDATVFAMSSRWEGLPLALIEAMTLGLPVVSTDCPSGPREVLDDGQFGDLVPVDNPAALADALARVLCDSRRRGELSALSRQRALCYSDARAVAAWEKVLATAAKK